VTVRAEQDDNADDETVEVSHMVASTDDAVYDAVTAAGVSVDVDDDDTAGVSVVPDTSLLPVSYTAASTDTAYNNLAGDVVTVTVTDDEVAGVTIVLAASLLSPVGEGGTGTYTVVLASEPSGYGCCDSDAADDFDVHHRQLDCDGHSNQRRYGCCDSDAADDFDVHHRQLGHGPDGDGDRRAGQQRGR
jgi:hypothetical protein